MASQPGKFPLDNLTYNIVTILHEKSKALQAYDQYMNDAQGDNEIRNLLQQIREQDTKHIQQLQQHLGRLIQKGGQQQPERAA